ncbi:response regulator transcription factor [Roseateles violae]|uniref:Response regulator n=1 Tax=Roseateles violae TaxID=3058042 RepID=A0ABT8DTY5_9BURK|nr:response regulator [Pelomonas sp. PFR6]MDN3920490.1 response regulator [Pelomonas sp. PFR6]
MNLSLVDHAPADSAAPTCFLVEDSVVIRENLIATLEEMTGISVVGSAEDEFGALHWLKSSGQACDLMIIDIFLKSGTGLEVLASAKALRPELKLVVLTNYATAEMRRRCLLLGADRVFDKSAELEELLAYCDTIPGGKALSTGDPP